MKTRLYTTLSGSTYEVDTEAKRVRRLEGKGDPTQRVGRDGTWKTYREISQPFGANGPLVIMWDIVGESEMLIARCTKTSDVLSVHEVERA